MNCQKNLQYNFKHKQIDLTLKLINQFGLCINDTLKIEEIRDGN